MQYNNKVDWIPYSAIYLDITFGHMAQALLQFASPADRYILDQLLQRIILNKKTAESTIEEKMLLTVSVRTAFDAILQVLNLPLGSEVVMTAVNIPDMVKMIRAHGLVPVPVDIQDETLGPTTEDFKNAFTDRTKLVLVSFIYGAKFEAEELFKFAHSKGCLVFEDQAESFTDVKDNGSPQADFTMFSFGTIKPFTALGGAITIVRNQEVIFRKAKDIVSNYPMMSKTFYFKKILKNMPVAYCLNTPWINSTFRPILSKLNYDYKTRFVSMVRGFQPKEDFLDTFRLQMPTPMLALLYIRMRDYNAVIYQMQVKKLRDAQDQLTKNGVMVPGRAIPNRAFWLYPIITENPKLAFEILNKRGVDAYLGATQLDLVESPIGFNYKYPQKTKDFFQKILYLPIHRDVPHEAIQKIVKQSIEVCNLVAEIEKDKRNKARPSL